MCGLVGVVGSGITAIDTKVFKQLLYMDALRGHHSTGICKQSATGGADVYKKALPASDFLQLDKAKQIASSIFSDFLMGHNRYATKGSITDETSHPYTHGNITLAHNGTLLRTTNLPDHTSFSVDSDNIAYAFAKTSPEETIKKLDGSFALTWYNDHELTFNIVRNSQRPMSMAKHTSKDVYYYASELSMLETALKRNLINYDIFEVEAGKIYSWDLSETKSKLSITDIEFLPPINNWDFNRQTTKNKQITTTRPKTKKSLFAENNLKVGQNIEFYTTGLNANAIEHVLKGHATDHNQLIIKIFNQRKTYLAGFYTGKLVAISTTYVNGGYDEVLVLNNPMLTELIENDPNNSGKETLVNALTKNKVIKVTKDYKSKTKTKEI